MTVEHESTETAGTRQGGPTDSAARRHGALSRCNTAQREPVAPDTPWGRLRAPTGWSLRELARRSGVNAGEISKIERGIGCPTPEQAARLLRAVDAS